MQNDWPSIVPLDSRPTPPYPVNALPARLANYVAEVAESYQVPIDLPAQLCLAVIGASTSKLIEIELTQDWREPVNLYIAAVLPSGQRKSAVFREITRPLERAEHERQHGQAQGAKRLLVDDVTPEQLATLLANNSGRIALMSSEGGVFDMMAGRYSCGIPNLDVYLKGHAGDTIRIDRKGSDSEIISRPGLSIALTIQPEILKAIAVQPGFRGRGLLARFLYSYPKSLLGHRKIDPKPVNTETRQHFYALIKTLLDWRDAFSAERPQPPNKLHLSPEASAIFQSYRESIERRLAPDGDLALIEDWGGKLTGAVARLAAIIHIAEHQLLAPTKQITGTSIQSAMNIGEYLLGHALLAFDAMGIDREIEGARRILDWLSRNEKGAFSERELFQDSKGWFKKMANLRPALHLLEERGYVRKANYPVNQSGRGRKPGPSYEANPAIIRTCNPSPQNSHIAETHGLTKKVREFWGF